jgi:hypothetical protein
MADNDPRPGEVAVVIPVSDTALPHSFFTMGRQCPAT